jgi:hypothetical protein
MKQSNRDFYKVSAIVDQFLIDNDLPNGFFPKALSWVLRGLREIKLDTVGDVKTVLLNVTDRKTANLPDNFVDWTKVGVRVGQYVVVLGVNDDLNTLPRTSSSPSVAGLMSQHMPNGIDFSQYQGYDFYNFSEGPLYGIGQGLPSKGYFKVHDNGTCKELLIDYDYSFSTIYLEYITDGLSDCGGDTVVSPYLFDYLVKFCDMMYEKKNNPKATNWSKSEAERDVYWAEKRLRARNNKITPQDILNITRQEARLTPHL